MQRSIVSTLVPPATRGGDGAGGPAVSARYPCADDVRRLCLPPEEPPIVVFVTERAAEALSIGAVARRAGLAAKALRHYDRIGPLRPSRIDSAAYRRYSASQVAIARRLALLRSVGVPLDEVRQCLRR